MPHLAMRGCASSESTVLCMWGECRQVLQQADKTKQWGKEKWGVRIPGVAPGGSKWDFICV